MTENPALTKGSEHFRMLECPAQLDMKTARNLLSTDTGPDRPSFVYNERG